MNLGNSNIYILFICIAVPMTMLLFLVEKRARQVIGFMTVGLYICLFSGNINGFIRNATNEDILYLTTTITPIVEECMKSLPILFYVLFISKKMEDIVNMGAAVGIGFTLLENTYILLNYDSPSVMWALARGFGSGLMHVICTVTVGYGLGYIWNNRKLAASNTFALLTAAIIYHAVYNALVNSSYPWLGFVLTLVTYVLVFFFLNRLFPNIKFKLLKKGINDIKCR